MDNLTHSLFGLTFAETALSARREEGESRWFRSAAYLTSVAANNLPDLDILYTWITMRPLGYLLHHRGHTHTFLGEIPLFALLMLIVYGATRIVRAKFDRAQWICLAVLAALGLVTHIALDSLNIYGVHPFWPFDSSWKYGDAVFILEPAFWLGLLPLPILAVKRKAFRAMYFVLFIMAIGTLWYSRLIPRNISLFLTLAGPAFLFLLSRFDPWRRALLTCGMAILILGVFDVGSRVTRAKYLEYHHRVFRNSSLKEVILSASPGNPFCWNVITVEVEGDTLLNRRGRFAPAPEWINAEACPVFRTDAGTANYRPVRALVTPSISWYDQAETSIAKMKSLRESNCQFREFLRFARAPFVVERDGRTIVGDVRFDFGSELGFSEFELGAQCPAYVPGWEPPFSF